MASKPPGKAQKVQTYQLRMKRRPTRAERRFCKILDFALKGFPLPFEKQTQANKRESHKFVKQKIFWDTNYDKYYIVDFYIPNIRLVFEIDGPEHEKNKVQDDVRTSFLASRNIRVERFTNESTTDFEKTLLKVREILAKRIEKILQPSKAIKENTTTESVEDFLARGGTITKLPTVGYKRKIYKRK